MKKLVSIILSALLISAATACASEDTQAENNSVISTATSSNKTPDVTFDITSENEDDTNTTKDTNTDKNSDTNSKHVVQSDIIFDTTEDTDTSTDSEINITNTNISTCKIFEKVVCCGDSYTAGYIADKDGNAHNVNENYAWPHYMSTLTGNKWLNCGCSGCTVLTWQKHARGLPAAKKFGKAQAYVIGLMINDVSSKNHVELGTIGDVGTNRETYYGGMSAIIRELNAISPEAKIFINTCPKKDDGYKEYNEAVRNIVNFYKNEYPVHCIDLEANADMYENESLTNDYWYGHYTAVGYEQFSEIYAVILSNYINEHIEEFRDVAFIEYDK